MEFDGEHLLPGQLGHFFVLLAFICSLLSTVAYVTASFKNDIAVKTSWIKFARIFFYVQTAAVLAVFSFNFISC